MTNENQNKPADGNKQADEKNKSGTPGQQNPANKEASDAKSRLVFLTIGRSPVIPGFFLAFSLWISVPNISMLRAY